MKFNIICKLKREYTMKNEESPIPGAIDLASESLSSKVIEATDDFFASKDNLIKSTPPIFIPDKYTENGKWMDGWESRRKRTKGHDWCIVRLGLPGSIQGINIDTTHFRGNHPPFASIDACICPNDNPGPTSVWHEILSLSALKPDANNLFLINSAEKCNYTHVRLNIFPDGGVARLRIYGSVVLSEYHMKPDLIDVIGFGQGGKVLACSDAFFSPMQNLILPTEPRNMGEGWETRRKRHAGNDWVIIQAAKEAQAAKVELSTSFFKGNYPDSFQLMYCHQPETKLETLLESESIWQPLIPQTKLKPDYLHSFEQVPLSPFTHLKLNTYPDGGVARLRVYGQFLV